ncbi:PREDICTED: pentatricopeptide repeat-containing protein At1g19720 isoform X2 [Theobroma cacao]|uniref:Pentatricopeptide repeat-containing protein At1g19720 isoform X2 n=1 Tax=Theobroma cacao TaxID=3641 RepID=A0AB32WQW1_THECC|nr:PREDICTED: pentatricopeptide repeat-containing protein At1g19720 isoform X2 [Theobroma cacao]
MENLMIPCTSKPPVIIPTKHENLSEFSQTPTKLAFSNTKKTNNPKISDSHLNYLSRNGRLTEAITALDSIAQSGSQVRANTFINLLQACIDFGSLELGRKLHARVHLVKESDPFVETKLVSMYAKCGSFVDARKVFDKMKERNLYAWSAMIGACSRELRWKEVVELFFLMMEDGVLPDEILFPKFLQACANCGDVRTGRLLHSLVIRLGMVCFARVSNSVLAVYAKCGKLSSARRFFENMNERDIVTWNSMILAYCQKGENDEAYGLFYGMWKDGIQPCLVTWNILINSYNQLGQCDVAMGLMKEMEISRIIPDVFTWTSMISGLAQNGRRWQALCLFKEMLLAGIKPNGVTITSAVSACASLRVLNMGREIHSIALKKGIIDNVLVGNSLIDMYAKCGELEAARQVFDKIEERDVYTWNSMVAGYCQAGYCGKAYELFMKMRESDLKPNVITWNTMISGYIQNGDEDRAMDLFQRMEQDGKIRRNTASWNAFIAGYVQLGEIDKAFGVFRQMQSCSVSSNSVTILSILPGCANLVAAKKVKEIHGCVLRRNLEFVLSISNSLIDTYAKSGNILYSRIIFDGMSTRDIISWNSIIGGYVLHGCSDAALDLFNQMRKLGLKPNRGTFLSIILAHGIDDNKPISVGPWGGQGGSSWDDGVYFTVRQLVIAHGSGIDSIQIEYDNKGNSIWSKKHGGGGGSMTDKVKLDYPDEFLTSVHGYYGILHERGPILVRSLTFFSNRKAYGPYGIEQGTSFSMTRGKIVGFHGRCGCFLDAIGTHSKPFSKLNPSKTIVHAQSFVADGAEKVGYSLIQGSVGEKYDIVLAVRQRDAYGNPLPRQLSRQSSSSSDDSSDVETRSKVSFRTPEKVPSKLPEGVLSYGPWGGNGGAKFDDGTYTGIRQITLSRNVGIVWIKACYDRDGQAVWGSKHGGTGGFKTDRIIFDYPSEILTHITGTFGPLMYMGPNVIKSLTFHTNKGKHGPYGDEQGPSFTNKMNEGRIIGFHGREGLFLDAVGVYVMEGKVPPPRPSISQAIIQSERSIAEIDNSPWSNKLVLARRGPVEEVACGVVKEPAPCGPGPWGGEGGRPWDDGVFSGIKQIFVTKSEAICSIQIEYDRNGQSVWSVKHGGHGGTTTHRVKLDHPHEVLICISGYYGPINNEEKSKVVRSLTFYSSRGKYGPFGEEIGTYFTSTTTEGKVVGFHGRNSSYLDAIGVHMQHWLGNQRTSRMSLFKIFS